MQVRAFERYIPLITCKFKVFSLLSSYMAFLDTDYLVPHSQKQVIKVTINRGSYMNAHVLLNLLNELGTL